MDENLAEKAYKYIKKRLLEGHLSPGSRLVNRALATEIGVSVIPVREAIGKLSSEGLVEQIPGSGAFVKKTDLSELEDLYVLREALESCAASEAAKFMSDFQRDRLEGLIKNSEKIALELENGGEPHATVEQMDRWLEIENEFHEHLIQCSKNKLLAKVTREYRAIGEVFSAQRSNPQLLTAQTAMQTCEGKRKLLSALDDRDCESARRIVCEQIQKGRDTVLTHFRNNV